MRTQCPSCRTTFTVRDTAAGRTVPCTRCQFRFKVESVAELPPDPESPPRAVPVPLELDDAEERPQPTRERAGPQEHRAVGTFASALGGSAGCIIGAAIGAVVVVGIAIVAFVLITSGGQVREAVRRVEEENRRSAEPRFTAGKESVFLEWAEVDVERVELAPVKYSSGKLSEKKYLQILLKLTVTDPKKVWEFSAWSRDDKLPTDPERNTYNHAILIDPPLQMRGFVRITSEEPAETLLVFDAPPPGTEELWLDLPADSVSRGHFFRFRIPRSAWKAEAPPQISPTHPTNKPTEAQQTERVTVLRRYVEQGVIDAVPPPGSKGTITVTGDALWHAMDEGDKTDLADVLAFYAFEIPNGGKLGGGQVVVFRDSRTGKDVAKHSARGFEMTE